MAALPSPPSLPHINQGLSERSIVGGAVPSFSFRPSLASAHRPTDRPPPDRPACSLPLLARRGQEISHTISEAAEAAAGKAIFLSRPPPPLSVSSSENRFDGGKCRAKSLSARRVLRPFNALRNHIWSGWKRGKERRRTRAGAGGLMLSSAEMETDRGEGGREERRRKEAQVTLRFACLLAIPCHHRR